jgi:hypothetical protein
MKDKDHGAARDLIALELPLTTFNFGSDQGQRF